MSPKVWTGSAWVEKPAKVWSGSAWVAKPVKVWTGSAWKTTGVATYNLFSGTPTFADQAVDSNAYSMGTEFYVNKSGCYVTKVRYLQPTVGTLAVRTMALYSTTNGTTGTKVGGDWTMPTPVAGAWCTYTLPTAIALTANTKYRITCLHPSNAGFARYFNYFWGGGTEPGHSTTTIGGYLVRPNHADSLNTNQGSFHAGSTMAFPEAAYQYASYYSDIEVQDVAP